MDSILFNFWFEQMLLPDLPAESVIVMDNAWFHQKKVLLDLARQHHCQVLLSCSPDVNPIENFWAWLESRLRKILPDFQSLDDAVSDCFKVTEL